MKDKKRDNDMIMKKNYQLELQILSTLLILSRLLILLEEGLTMSGIICGMISRGG